MAEVLRALARLRKARASPGAERFPGALVETEAVDGYRRLERAHPQQAGAGPLEAALLDYPARSGVDDPAARGDGLEPRVGEGVINHRAHRLGGKTIVPVGLAGPVAELGLGLAAVGVAAGA